MDTNAFTEKYPNMDDREKRVFAEVMQELQGHCFILRGGAIKRNSHYAFIEKHEEAVSAFLEMAGWKFQLDREIGVARLYHPEGSGRAHFNKEETTLILALRLIYHEEKQAVSESPDVVVSVGTIREKLHAILPDAAVRPFLSRKNMGAKLRRLEQFRIISFETSSFSLDDDTMIVLQPVLEHLVNAQSIEETSEKLAALYATQAASDVQVEDQEEPLGESQSQTALEPAQGDAQQ